MASLHHALKWLADKYSYLWKSYCTYSKPHSQLTFVFSIISRVLPPCSWALSSIKHKCACRHTDQTPVLACVWPTCLEAVFPVKRPCLETLWVFTAGCRARSVCDWYLVGRQQGCCSTHYAQDSPRLSLPPLRMDWPEGPRYGGPGQQHVRQKADPDYRRIPEGNKVKAHWNC